MSTTLHSFMDIFETEFMAGDEKVQLKKIAIPLIQRDYAQGRQSQKVDEIRKVFVHTLLLVVKGKRSATELDFVYGSNQNNAFEPLDGQQRLTSLYLLLNCLGIKTKSTLTFACREKSNYNL